MDRENLVQVSKERFYKVMKPMLFQIDVHREGYRPPVNLVYENKTTGEIEAMIEQLVTSFNRIHTRYFINKKHAK